MQIVRFAAFGVPRQVAACVEVPGLGAPAEGEVVVEVEVFPINPVGLRPSRGAIALADHQGALRHATRPELPASPAGPRLGDRA